MIRNRLVSRAIWTDNGRRSLHVDDACIAKATSHPTALRVAWRRFTRIGETDPARSTRASTPGAALYKAGASRPYLANHCAAGRRLPPARGEERYAVAEPRSFLCGCGTDHAPHHGRSRTPAARA